MQQPGEGDVDWSPGIQVAHSETADFHVVVQSGRTGFQAGRGLRDAIPAMRKPTAIYPRPKAKHRSIQTTDT